MICLAGTALEIYCKVIKELLFCLWHKNIYLSLSRARVKLGFYPALQHHMASGIVSMIPTKLDHFINWKNIYNE